MTESIDGLAHSTWKWLTNHWRNSFAFFVGIVLPLALIFFDWWEYKGYSALWPDPRAPHLWMLLLAFGVAIAAWLIARRRLEPQEREEIAREFRFYFLSSPAPLLIGGALSLFFLGIFFTLPHAGRPVFATADYSARYEAALSLYLTTMGVVLALYALFKRNAPIVEWNQLLRILEFDLSEAERHGGDVWIVYPALNLAYFRNVIAIRRHNGHTAFEERAAGRQFWEKTYEKPLEDVLKSQKCTFRAITYAPEYVKLLFNTYSRGRETLGLPDADKDLVCKSLMDSASRLHGLANSADPSNHFARYSNIRYRDPQGFPPHVIVVGDAVYSITTYGMPVFVQSEGKGRFLWPAPAEVAHAGGDGPAPHANAHDVHGGSKVRLLAYRRKDPIIAEHVKAELELVWQDCIDPSGEAPQRLIAAPGAPPLTIVS